MSVEASSRREPVRLFEVAPTAQAHTAFADAVAGVFAYVDPVLQTVAAEAHSNTGEEDERVVELTW